MSKKKEYSFTEKSLELQRNIWPDVPYVSGSAPPQGRLCLGSSLEKDMGIWKYTMQVRLAASHLERLVGSLDLR
ncbi:hypothetical protein TNCV_1035611 [Trichonephila clavipes]|nr:hypothetical protein TNCV_1035611 [Trichonephila clavipes]